MILPEGAGTQPAVKFDPTLIAMIRRTVPTLIAEELVNVQPMASDTIEKLREVTDTRSPDEMRADGWEPVDPLTQLLWVKKA